MSLIKEEIINDFVCWAETNENKNIYPKISKDEVSYYVDREFDDTYIMEYSFKTMAELRKYLEKYAGLSLDTYMIRKLAIQICQNRYYDESEFKHNKSYRKKEDDDKLAENTLPEYIYTL